MKNITNNPYIGNRVVQSIRVGNTVWIKFSYLFSYRPLPGGVSFVNLFFICVCLCLTVMSVSCSLVVTFLERADLLAFLYVMFSCVFVTVPFSVLIQVWYLIV